MQWTVAATLAAQSTSGTFFPAQVRNTALPFYPSPDIATADLNEDGVPDVVAANGVLTVGPNTMPLWGVLYNENGSTYGPFAGGPSTFPLYVNGFRRAAVADFDEDGRDDVVTLTFPFELVFSRNQGQGKTVQGFPTHTVVAPSFASLLGLTFPNTLADPVAYVPVFLVGDFDHDGHADLVLGVSLAYGLFIGGGPPAVSSGGLVFFFGNGNGTFAPPQLVSTFDAPIDAEYVDWDGNGIADTLMLLGQTAFVTSWPGQYQAYLTLYDVVTTSTGTRAISPRGQAQNLGGTTYTSFVYVPDTATTPRVLGLAGHEFPTPSTMRPFFWVAEIDAMGSVAVLPARITPTILGTANCDFQGVQAADFDLDGHLDLVALVEGETNIGGSLQPTEIAFVAGPFDASGAHGVTGSMSVAPTWSPAINRPPGPAASYIFAPNRAYPSAVQVVDLDRDRAPDLVVGDSFMNALGGTIPCSISVLNLTPTVLGLQSGGVGRIGFGSPNPSGRLARSGTQGGAPVYGNASFQICLRDAPMSGLAVVVGSYSWAPHATLGLQMAFAPDSFGALQVLNAAQEGAGRLEQSLPLPTNPALLGAASALFQWVIFDANTGTLECSDAIHVRYAP